MIDLAAMSDNNSFESTIIASLYSEIANYNGIVWKDKPFFEVLASGLQNFLLLPNTTMVSLFLLNQEDFTFQLKSSLPLPNEIVENEKMLKLIEVGTLAEVLNTLNPTVTNLDDDGVQVMVLPLTTQLGINGVVILTFTEALELPNSLLLALRAYSNHFSLIINNFQLGREVNSIKENIEQIIALRTLDLSQSSRELRLIFDSLQTGLLLIDKSTDLISDANVIAAEIIGTTKDWLVGNSSQNFFFKSGKQTNAISTNQEGLLKRKNGSFIPIIRTVAHLEINHSEFIVISFIDISERKKMEEELERARLELEMRVQKRTLELTDLNQELQVEITRRTEAEEDLLKFYWAVQQNPSMITLTDANGLIQYVNPKFTEITGYEFSEILNSDAANFYPHSTPIPDVEVANFSDRIFAFSSQEHPFLRKDGSTIWVQTLVSPIINIEGKTNHYVLVQENITLKKEAEQQILIAKEKAEESDKLKTNILANMSHELRTPLIGVIGFSEILMDEIQDAMLLDMTRKINFSGKRLLHTLNTMLFLSQMDRRDLRPSFERINLTEIFVRTVLSFKDRAEEKKLTYTLNTPHVDLFISGTEEMMVTALIHLLDNAIKFTQKGFITCKLEKLSAENGKQIAVIQIQDSGVGINPNSIQHIFEPFRQDSEGFGRNFEGSGLGLTLTKKICTLIGGTIEVESEMKVGTKFIIKLPIE